jgi:glycerol-3-phosphate acyltransferase PlsY
VNEFFPGSIAVVIGYLLGSIPAAYIVTRLFVGKDIRQLGGGNAGTRNVFSEVGKRAGIIVGIVDLGKGAATIAVAYAFRVSLPFVLIAGLAAVAGHIWSIYRKFTGGNGLATTLGILAVLLPWELLIAIAVILVFIVITHNIILSVNISLFSVSVSTWFIEHSWQFAIYPLSLILVMMIHFLPKVRASFLKAGSKENFMAELLRCKKT